MHDRQKKKKNLQAQMTKDWIEGAILNSSVIQVFLGRNLPKEKETLEMPF